MSLDDIRSGSVIAYPYLWVREAEKLETEGRKKRPVAVGVRLPRPDGEDALLLFAITSQPPANADLGVEIPDAEKRRAGLDEDKRLWIMLGEYNQDLVRRSFYLEPDCLIGHFGRVFFLKVMKSFVAARANAKVVRR